MTKDELLIMLITELEDVQSYTDDTGQCVVCDCHTDERIYKCCNNNGWCIGASLRRALKAAKEVMSKEST